MKLRKKEQLSEWVCRDAIAVRVVISLTEGGRLNATISSRAKSRIAADAAVWCRDSGQSYEEREGAVMNFERGGLPAQRMRLDFEISVIFLVNFVFVNGLFPLTRGKWTQSTHK